MIKHPDIEQKILISKIKQREILFAGNIKLKIFETLHCKSGKRMKRENRIFFQLKNEATGLGYRPCGHCMKEEYEKWKRSLIK